MQHDQDACDLRHRWHRGAHNDADHQRYADQPVEPEDVQFLGRRCPCGRCAHRSGGRRGWSLGSPLPTPVRTGRREVGICASARLAHRSRCGVYAAFGAHPMLVAEPCSMHERDLRVRDPADIAMRQATRACIADRARVLELLGGGAERCSRRLHGEGGHAATSTCSRIAAVRPISSRAYRSYCVVSERCLAIRSHKGRAVALNVGLIERCERDPRQRSCWPTSISRRSTSRVRLSIVSAQAGEDSVSTEDGPVERLPLPNRAANSDSQRVVERRKRRIYGASEASRVGVRCYLMNSTSEYFGSGQRSSATSFSSLSAISRTSFIAGMTVSRM